MIFCPQGFGKEQLLLKQLERPLNAKKDYVSAVYKVKKWKKPNYPIKRLCKSRMTNSILVCPGLPK